jgi:glycosyltransferase involved in cell wall biosynthesis
MREAIDSALSQTYENIEVIVVNDGSNDGGATDEIARSYGDRIRYFTKTNGGVSSALNFGIENMCGEYFSWLSHDDVYEVDKVEKQILSLNNYGSDGQTLVYCGASIINEFSQPISGQFVKSNFESNKVYTSSDVLMQLLKKATFNGCCLLIPKKVFSECGRFDESLRFCQDAVMWYRIFMSNYSLVCIDDLLVKSRVHPRQLTQTGQSLFKKECNEISGALAPAFSELSTKEHNFLKAYLLSDARYFYFKTLKDVLSVGKEKKIISIFVALKAYVICAYGVVRPTIRKIYYRIFRRMKTN